VPQSGHGIEWLVPDDDGDSPPPVQACDAGGGLSHALGRRWWHAPSPLLRRPLWALLLLGVLVLATVVVLNGRSPDPLSPAPGWLVHRPIGAALSPFMTGDCGHGDCSADWASERDLHGIRGLVGTGVAVGGIRVFNAHHQLRGVSVWARDAQGDQVYVNAVRVSTPAAGWDGQTAILDDGSLVSRWVLHTSSGIWLAEADAGTGCDGSAPDGGGPEAPAFFDITVNRLQPAQLHL
jgi:hypothetical protein